MAYTPHYPGGWQDFQTGGTIVSADALNNMEQGIENAHEDVAAAQADADAAQVAADAVAADVAALATVASTGQYADVDNTPTIPTAAADVGAMPANVRIWNGAVWSARPTVPAGWTVEGYSDGSYGSTRDADATPPSAATAGDAWNRTY